MSHLAAEAQQYSALRERLLAAFPELSEDDQTLADTLEGLSDLTDQIAAVIRSALDDEAFVAALDKRIADMQARKQRLAERVEKKRSIAADAMGEAGLQKLVTDDLTVSLAKGRAKVVITGDVPPEYLRQPPPVPDKRAIEQALKNGSIIAGATLSNTPPILTVRSK